MNGAGTDAGQGDVSLHALSVPVILHYLDRMDALLAGLAPSELCLLDRRLAPDGFQAHGHFACAQGYALRAVFPVAGRPVPDLPEPSDTRVALRARSAAARAHLAGITPGMMADGAAHRVRHEAGFATLEQDATDYLTLYALPNFIFHLSQGFAILRAQGLPVGKADFDGFHSYPAGFSWVKDGEN
ncbi:DUF1993 family protein [Oceanomicrobium pacificus]|uniref:DUF1993 family protein n=1 Tax=Oceanomicrobium pacificus TaxID=2692916 RepID=A0A6B0TXM6_9RHOB|nr:DUF1993 family protein [Oceanomicrobium pacificus]MXU65884.1 DUF1993 family protein [Oceanomicrobium pacificus]